MPMLAALLYTPLVARRIHGACRCGASLPPFKIVPGELATTARLVLASLAAFFEQRLRNFGTGLCSVFDILEAVPSRTVHSRLRVEDDMNRNACHPVAKSAFEGYPFEKILRL